MKKPTNLAVAFAVCIAAAMAVAGCGEQDKSDTKISRLVAAENIELKEQIERQKQLLAECLQEKKDSEKHIQDSIKGMTDMALTNLEENIKLTEENKKLKAQMTQLEAQITQLEARIRQLETQLEELKKPGGPEPLSAEPEPL